jgi:ATP-dependent DNA ligase
VTCFSRQGAPEALLYAFDLLELDGCDLRGEPCQVRRAALTKILRHSAHPAIERAMSIALSKRTRR